MSTGGPPLATSHAAFPEPTRHDLATLAPMFGSRRRRASPPETGRALVDPWAGDALIPRVDFFIVGAMKCGTTTLRRVLGAHPDVHLPDRELHFFGNHERYQSVWRDGQLDAEALAEHYGGHFRTDAPVQGEKTPNYMISSLTIERIQRFHPEAKILVMVREPVSRAESHWNHLLRQRSKGRMPGGLSMPETLLDHLAENRRELEGSRRPDAEVRGTNILHRGLYAGQIRRIQRFFPHDRVLIGVLDDLRDDRRTYFERVFAFLGIAFDEAAVRTERDRTGDEKVHRLSADERSLLSSYYAESVTELESLLGRELPNWRRP